MFNFSEHPVHFRRYHHDDFSMEVIATTRKLEGQVRKGEETAAVNSFQIMSFSFRSRGKVRISGA